LFDAGHAVLFGVVMLLVSGLPWVRSGGKALLITLLLAAASEILQLADPTRDASIGDFLRDGAGAVAFLLLRASSGPPADRRVPGSTVVVGSLALRLAASGLLLSVAAPFLLVCGIYIERNRAFPTLFRLDGSWWESRLISTGNATLVTSVTSPVDAHDGVAALLLLRPGVSPGVVFDEPFPDWSAFHRLAFTVLSVADAPITLTIRVHDEWHDQRFADRFNRRIAIAPGENRVSIPLNEIRQAPVGREMDLHRVRSIMLFVYRLDRPARVYLGPLVLE